ncbi:diaminopimelate decarboxylase [Kineosporia rhizophila]|uniref:diaminopimelate decarboxylase n=1 Tax=Kineosporia TaxID=49184 RepID=UPI001E4974AC|nr:MULTISPECIES: diaminopimelate decarboxylase [Kineosporia]MCE0539664.1 diaminopimelate decarboxylase [Kineosporia rhizophila]GLY17908.1 diaminopimelate decarboxylase [Kineosporia sp. NBRC 101677]
MGTHEAGELHSPGHGGVATVPGWLRPPGDVNDLLPGLWAQSVHRSDDGVLQIGGVSVTDLAAEFGTPAFVLDEADFRARATAFRDAFASAFAGVGGADVYYAGKAFLCTEVARWIAEDGLFLDTCSGGELAVALRGGVPPERIALHGNNKLPSEIDRAVAAGIGRIVIDSMTEIDRVAEAAARHGVVQPVFIRVTVGVEAHTHEYVSTAHEDQKFGLSLAGGVAAQAIAKVLASPSLKLLGLHSHIGSQIFDTQGFEVSARRLLGLHASVERDHGVALPEIDLGGGYGIAYTSQHDPLEAKLLADQLADIVLRECRALQIAVPRVSVEPGRAIAGPSTFTLYQIGTLKDVTMDGGGVRRYVSVDGGMSDNIRTALYDADYSCTLASRSSDAPAALCRVVGKHCESGDIVVRDEFLPGDLTPGDLLAVPGTGAYCRSMASQYNHVPRPPVVAVRDGRARVIVRRETEEDILALDVV